MRTDVELARKEGRILRSRPSASRSSRGEREPTYPEGELMAKKKAATRTTPEDETKRNFREALEAKQGRQGEAHLDGESPIQHAHGPVETKRTFRRKTG